MDEMDRLADLKTALYPTEAPGERLRERALAGVDARPARAGRARPTLVVAGVAVLAASAVAVGALRAPQSSPGRTDTAAPRVAVQNVGFTMRVNADGSVAFTATQLVDPAAATVALNNAGIAGRVVVHRDACAPVNWDDVAVFPPMPPTPRSPFKAGITGDETKTLRSSDYPPGGGLLVVVVIRQYPEGTRAFVAWLGYRDVNRIPTCVQLHDPGTGADPQ